MTIVGGSFAVSDALVGAPLAAAQVPRYLLGAALLLLWARWRRIPVPRPTGPETLRLALLAATGLTGFNVCVVLALGHAEPAALGVVVGIAPLLLTVLPLGRRPQARLLVAATVVLAGVALVEGGGRTDAVGVLLCAGALAGEVGFTLLAVPLLPRLGAVAVSVHSCVLAAVQFTVLAPLLAAATGTPVLRAPTAAEAGAVAFLAVAVTAVAFVLWYGAVVRLGSDRAGLLIGIMPVSALLTGLALGIGATPLAAAGAALVGIGVAAGLTGQRQRETATRAEDTTRQTPSERRSTTVAATLPPTSGLPANTVVR
jgi:drug/metabolite transporter (DMT)-like permease